MLHGEHILSCSGILPAVCTACPSDTGKSILQRENRTRLWAASGRVRAHMDPVVQGLHPVAADPEAPAHEAHRQATHCTQTLSDGVQLLI